MRIDARKAWLALGAVALVQTGVLGAMIYERASLLKGGREITLPVVPVDPRSLFRGDYVILSYPVSQVAIEPGRERPERNAVVYVTLERAEDGWKAVAIADRYPEAIAEGRVVLKGRVASRSRVGTATAARETVQVRYGVESYFVPEGAGRELERKVRERAISAVVAVGRDGTAAIKGLVVDGETVYVEPLL